MTPTEAAITILRARCQFSDEQICHDIRLLLAQRDRYEKALLKCSDCFELVRQATQTVGSDYGLPHIARMAESMKDQIQEALRCE